MLLSNSYPGGTGPLFNQPVTHPYTYTTRRRDSVRHRTRAELPRRSHLTCAGYPSRWAAARRRARPTAPRRSGPGPTISTSTVTVPTSACLYNGPTRVKLNGDGTATSPARRRPPAGLRHAVASATRQRATRAPEPPGMSAQTVNLTGISVISVQNHGARHRSPRRSPTAAADGTSPGSTTARPPAPANRCLLLDERHRRHDDKHRVHRQRARSSRTRQRWATTRAPMAVAIRRGRRSGRASPAARPARPRLPRRTSSSSTATRAAARTRPPRTPTLKANRAGSALATSPT